MTFACRNIATGVALLALCLAIPGCSSKSGGGSSSSSSGGSSSSNDGKTYTPDTKPGAKQATAGSGSGSGELPAPANTVNGKASADSDSGTIGASKGQAVMNPGAPAENTPKPH